MSGTSPGADGGVDRVPVLQLSVVVVDRGVEPEWHRDRTMFGPWWRYEAELPDFPAVCELGTTPWDAVYRLVAIHRPVLERRWSPGGPAA